ncbi:AAA family ATPase, partial [Salmonella enterica subsp. enterica serovar Istanbul]|nr:AAA family ATPase [Salmonella enterica subsp. enterica serovar Istanbul]
MAVTPDSHRIRRGSPIFLDLATDLKDRVPFSQLSRSVVLFGETGTGKTTLAKLVAKHMNRPLLAYSVADLFARSDG